VQDLSETALKFLRYSLPQLIAEYAPGLETRAKK
jgi:hypothetical protein